MKLNLILAPRRIHLVTFAVQNVVLIFLAQLLSIAEEEPEYHPFSLGPLQDLVAVQPQGSVNFDLVSRLLDLFSRTQVCLPPSTPNPQPQTLSPKPSTPSHQPTALPHYRGTALTRKRTPLRPYRRPMPRVLGGS